MPEEDKKNFVAVNLEFVEIEKEALALVREDMCRKLSVIPISRSGGFLTVAMANPKDLHATEEIRFVTGMKLKPVMASEEDIIKALDTHFNPQTSPPVDDGADDALADLDELIDEDRGNSAKLPEQFEEAPVVKLVNTVLLNAIKQNASHIHLEPTASGTRVRFRVDGVLRDVMKIPPKMKDALNSRMKILTNLDISERRLPQDGRLYTKIQGKSFEFRLATLPTLHGERIVLVLHQSVHKQMNIDELGFTDSDLARFKQAIKHPSGLVLVTGPRGSGKTTTLYAAIDELNTGEVNILTVENPITQDLEGIGQTQIREEIGYNYVSALRNMMRQDPDIIMVQEIGDLETADKAFQLSLDGYLILSSMNTGDVPAALLKLLELGISPSMINAAVRFVLSQRLVRKVCDNCKAESSATQDNLESIKNVDPLQKTGEWDQKTKIYFGEGCSQCGNTGYRGRIPVCETLILTPQIRKTLLDKPSHQELREAAMSEGMTTMAQDALDKVKRGETTMDECLRIFSLFL